MNGVEATYDIDVGVNSYTVDSFVGTTSVSPVIKEDIVVQVTASGLTLDADDLTAFLRDPNDVFDTKEMNVRSVNDNTK